MSDGKFEGPEEQHFATARVASVEAEDELSFR
jgi:hypothetical protein